jgi:hypothetical protein
MSTINIVLRNVIFKNYEGASELLSQLKKHINGDGLVHYTRPYDNCMLMTNMTFPFIQFVSHYVFFYVLLKYLNIWILYS